ncbi:erythromycin esterase family protein [Rhodocytophaga rosea]|uniref:Erythromycin esterase family protein n=1 Tax=Rhodocytophaga rosea TaxID=2704465 RepID=A0A6C0GPI9_9BACT|nr:erythromycin esterase family protein [Rhodocytophaga rosea]QHT69523.1 erythromycin esterase family protein [Rhodocytophaga rosea]
MKKILKRTLLFIVLTPVVLTIIGFVFYWVYALLAVGGENSEHQAYLHMNKEVIQPGTENSFTLFDADFYNQQIFLLGEVHGFAIPQVLDIQLLTHLNQKVGLKYYLAEVDYSQAYFLNEYLQTGNDTLLSYVFKTWVNQNAQWGNKNFYNKIRQIRSLNQRLPADKQIKILGVDRIQDMAVTNRYLQQLLKQQNYQTGKNPLLDKIQQLTASDTISMQTWAAQANQILTDADSLSKHMLGKETFNCMFTLQNIAYYQPVVNRDSVMYLNLKALTSEFHLENEKMYGLWGFFHTMQVPIKRDHMVWPFAALLKHSQDSPFRNKVVSLNIYALDSENMMPGKMLPASIRKGKSYFNTSWANSDGPLAFVGGIKDLRAVSAESTATLFKLNGANSPYRTSSRLAETKVLIPGQSLEVADKTATTEDVFQYVILLRNGEALEPIEN